MLKKDKVSSIEIQGGKISARLEGSVALFLIKLLSLLDPFTKQEWKSVLDIMASRAIFAAKLLSGEIPTKIEKAFQEAHIFIVSQPRERFENGLFLSR